ncbi:MAG: diphthine--ammonia ligase [Ignavibacteriae bacterium]|nr:diphthine--ammonia ligase [Ignavibacteriota bacterium]
MPLEKERVLVSWSGGKDSAMALYEIHNSQQYTITALLTTVTEGYDRISMHGVRRTLLERQAEALGLPLREVFISQGASNQEYESKMRDALTESQKESIASVVFGDIFLEDIRRYRERLLSDIGMKAIFPIWKKNTTQLARAFIENGFKAVVVCTDPKVLDKTFAGRIYDKNFLHDLPPTIDPCGENGEFHSFVFDAPFFKSRIACTIGEVVLRDSFYFCDLMPV